MRYLKTFLHLAGAVGCILVIAGLASAQWGSAVLEPVATGPENDHVSRSALELDDLGDLHLIFDRWAGGGDHDFYYATKPNSGIWSTPELLGDPSAQLQSPFLAVHKGSGEPYVVYLQSGFLKLAKQG